MSGFFFFFLNKWSPETPELPYRNDQVSANGDVCKSTGNVTLHKNPDYRFAGVLFATQMHVTFLFFLVSESGL